jgi:asparagine synthase (glutamine-hydrolysing)
LEFAYAIPREQVVRVGQRRSLMKRALVGIVPEELLKRRRTGFVPHKFRKDASAELPSSGQIGQHIIGGSIGIINPIRFLEELQKARQREVLDVSLLMRTLTLESWLRHLTVQGLLGNAALQMKGSQSSSCEPHKLQVPSSKSSAS